MLVINLGKVAALGGSSTGTTHHPLVVTRRDKQKLFPTRYTQDLAEVDGHEDYH